MVSFKRIIGLDVVLWVQFLLNDFNTYPTIPGKGLEIHWSNEQLRTPVKAQDITDE